MVCLGHSRQSWYVRIIRVTGNLGNAVVRSPMKASPLGTPDGQVIKRFGRVTARLANPTHEKRCAKERVSQANSTRFGSSDCAAKINCFSFPPNQLHLRASRLIEEGRTRRHDTWSAGSGGRDSVARARHCRAVSGFVLGCERSIRAGRAALLRTAKACGSGTRGWCQAGGGFRKPNRVRKTVNPAAMEARGIRLQGERAISRQTIAQGRPDALR